MDRRISIDGKNFLLTTDDQYLDAVGNDFEPHMVDLYKTFIEPESMVVDIGGNIGLTAILFSSLAQKVYAFEPSASTFGILKENLRRAGTQNTEIFNLGMGEHSEESTITFAENNRSGAFVSNKIRPDKGHITETIKIVTLDDFFGRHDQPIDFIKIDVEGFETSVIKGGAAILQKYRPVVTLELNVFCLDVLHRITIPEYFEFLRSVFPRLYAVDNDNISICDLHDEAAAYRVMHDHIVHHRFLNLIGGFDDLFVKKINSLQKTAQKKAGLNKTVEMVKNLKAIKNTVKKQFNGFLGTSSEEFSETADRRGQMRVNHPPETVRPGDIFFLDVGITNQGTGIWKCMGNHPVQLSYHWQTHDGECIVHDGERSRAGCDQILPGSQIFSRMRVIAPVTAGSVRLIVTMVQEGVCWFEDHGFIPVVLEIFIKDSLDSGK